MQQIDNDSAWNQKIQSYWADKLVKVPADLLSNLKISDKSRVFLETIGLPLDDRFGAYSGLYFEFAPNNIFQLQFRDKYYIAIGKRVLPFLEGIYFLIVISYEANKIYLVDSRDEDGIIPIQFVNSEIQTFLLFLQIRLKYALSLTELRKQEDVFYKQPLFSGSPMR